MEPRIYRGFNEDSHEWKYGQLVYYPMPFLVDQDVIWKIVSASIGEGVMIRDSQGIDVYTGDYIEYHNELYVVKYVAKYARYSAVRPGTVFTSILKDKGNFKVIGNEFQNPRINLKNPVVDHEFIQTERLMKTLRYFANQK